MWTIQVYACTEASFAFPQIQHTMRAWLHRNIGIKKYGTALRSKVKGTRTDYREERRQLT